MVHHHIDKENDVYHCPAGNELPYKSDSMDKKRKLRMYFDFAACRNCKIRHKCTSSKTVPRRIKRWIHEDILDEAQKYLDSSSFDLFRQINLKDIHSESFQKSRISVLSGFSIYMNQQAQCEN